MAGGEKPIDRLVPITRQQYNHEALVYTAWGLATLGALVATSFLIFNIRHSDHVYVTYIDIFLVESVKSAKFKCAPVHTKTERKNYIYSLPVSIFPPVTNASYTQIYSYN